MKKTTAVIILVLVVVLACSGGGESPATLPPPPPVDQEEPDYPVPETDKTIFIYDPIGQTIGTSEGNFYYGLDVGKSANARDGFVSIGDVMHDIDVNGISQTTIRLPVEPDAVTISGYIWCFENIDPIEAESQGGLSRWYIRIYRGPDEYGNWQDNQWKTVDAISPIGGDILAIDDQGIYHSVTEPDLKIRFAAHNGVMVHSIDAANHRAYIRGHGYDTRVTFNTNYFFGADQWVKAGGTWYSWNGYTWDGTVLTELSNKLSDFVTLWYAERPVLVAVGSRTEHSESVTYWVECNTGWLYRHTPSIDALEQVARLYQGDGTRNAGLAARNDIKPVLAGDNLFFGWSGTIWKYNFNDSMVSSFASGVEIWKM